MSRSLISLLCLTLSACAWSPETRVEESVYQALGAIDIVQSMKLARREDRYYEAAPLCSAIIGPRPTARQELAYGLGRAGLHALITNALRDGWQRRVWEGVAIANEGYWVQLNYRIGL